MYDNGAERPLIGGNMEFKAYITVSYREQYEGEDDDLYYENAQAQFDAVLAGAQATFEALEFDVKDIECK